MIFSSRFLQALQIAFSNLCQSHIDVRYHKLILQEDPRHFQLDSSRGKHKKTLNFISIYIDFLMTI